MFTTIVQIDGQGMLCYVDSRLDLRCSDDSGGGTLENYILLLLPLFLSKEFSIMPIAHGFPRQNWVTQHNIIACTILLNTIKYKDTKIYLYKCGADLYKYLSVFPLIELLGIFKCIKNRLQIPSVMTNVTEFDDSDDACFS